LGSLAFKTSIGSSDFVGGHWRSGHARLICDSYLVGTQQDDRHNLYLHNKDFVKTCLDVHAQSNECRAQKTWPELKAMAANSYSQRLWRKWIALRHPV
jgi:hypothetical protein